MARKKKKAAKKTRVESEAPSEPVEEEKELLDAVEIDKDGNVVPIEDQEPAIADPFGSGETEDGAAKEETATEPEVTEEKAPASPPDRPTVTFAEKKAQERGEKPSDGDPEKWAIVEFIGNTAYKADDIEAVDYYKMAGVSVLTMSDGRKFDVTD